MVSPQWVFRPVLVVALALLVGCGGSAPITTATPSDPQVNSDARAVYKYLAALTNDDIAGVVVGQNAGHGNQIDDPAGNTGYNPLLQTLQEQTGQTPAFVGLDYEHEKIFTLAELSQANKTLIAHWNKGGLVTINWAPHSPWLNNESDLTANPGVWTNTRTVGNNLAGVDLRKLVDPASDIFPIWRRKLDRVAAALQELQRAGVVVLWRPMQEMNGHWFWWGTSTQPTDSARPYIAIWQDMYHYFTQEKGLHNLLWVYSPVASGPGNASVTWAYPGNAYVDVIGGTAYGDTVTISDYTTYLGFGKPVAMAELGPGQGGSNSLNATFDNTRYNNRLQRDYPGVAYWISWHDYYLDSAQTQTEHLSIVSQRNAKALMEDPNTITLSRLGWKSYR